MNSSKTPLREGASFAAKPLSNLQRPAFGELEEEHFEGKEEGIFVASFCLGGGLGPQWVGARHYVGGPRG
jgi:hypothetical protein